MKRLLLFLTLILISGLALASPYRISLLTCGPGDELYSTFGHTAMRVTNTETGSDAVYNFGMFNFADPNFYMKFVKGDLDYYLGIQSFEHFVWEYAAEKRYVYEQVLGLTDIQTERILAELDYRDLPENRAYKYKFIQRNCTTELRDIIVEAVDENGGFLYAEADSTWRRYLNECLFEKPWAKIGINIILGSRVDVGIDNFQMMCLPRLLYDGLPEVAQGGGLVREDIVINPDTRGAGHKNFMARNYPYILLILISLGIILANSRVADAIYCFVLGALGLLIVFLMFYGTHMEFKVNFNLLLYNPLLIWLGIAIVRKRRGRLPAIVAGVLLLGLYVIWAVGIQGAEAGLVIMSAPLLWIVVKYLFLDKKIFARKRIGPA